MLTLIRLEKWTLVRGWIVSSLIIFPFTFLPVLSGEGTLTQRLWERIPESLLYASSFAIVLVFAAVYQNYEKLKKKMEYYKRPAFKALGFEMISSGQKSLVEEFDFSFLGYHDYTLYRVGLDIDLEYDYKNKIIIQPYPILKEGKEYTEQIKELAIELGRNYQVSRQGNDLSVILEMDENKLDNPNFFPKFFTHIQSKI